METYYEVTYKDGKGVQHRETRDTVERGFYLYKEYVKDGMTDVVLREVSPNGTAQLRPMRTETPKEEEPKVAAHEERKVTNWFEELCGMPVSEYRECLEKFASLHGNTLEDWGLEDFGKE